MDHRAQPCGVFDKAGQKLVQPLVEHILDLQRLKLDGYATQVRAHLSDMRPEVATAAQTRDMLNLKKV